MSTGGAKSEEVFRPPEAKLDDPEDALFAPLPPDRHHRPIGRRAAQLRNFALVGALAAIFLAGFVLAQRRALSPPGLAFLALLWLAVISWNLYRSRQVPQWIQRNDEAATLLAGGERERAGEELELLTRTSRHSPMLHAYFVLNRGIAYLWQGDLERAMSLFAAVLKSGWTREPRLQTLHPTLLNGIAIGFALDGKLEAADVWRRRAHEATTPAKLGGLALLDAIIEIRSGRCKEAADDVRERWWSAEGALNAPQMKALRVVRAFALEQVGGEDAEIAEMLGGARPFRPGELGYLAVRWPELRAFLAKNGLS